MIYSEKRDNIQIKTRTHQKKNVSITFMGMLDCSTIYDLEKDHYFKQVENVEINVKLALKMV